MRSRWPRSVRNIGDGSVCLHMIEDEDGSLRHFSRRIYEERNWRLQGQSHCWNLERLHRIQFLSHY